MELLFILTFLLACISSILSGMAGGGGSYIMAPYWLFIGMTPAQGATTGASMAIAMSASSLFAFRRTGHLPNRKKLTIGLSLATLLASAVGAISLSHVDVEAFKAVLACVTLVSVPLSFVNRRALVVRARWRTIGLVLLFLLLVVSSIIASSAFSLLISLGLTHLFGLGLIESTALRRVIGLVQSGAIFAVLVAQGNFLPFHAIAGCVGGALGSYIGTRIAIGGGEVFAKYTLAAGALISGVILLI